MTLEEVFEAQELGEKFFKTDYQLAKKLKIHHTNVVRWHKQNFIPIRQQMNINDLLRAKGIDVLPIDRDKKEQEERLKAKHIDLEQ